MLVVEGVLNGSADQFDAEEAERLLAGWFASSLHMDPASPPGIADFPPAHTRESRFLHSVLQNMRTELIPAVGRPDEVQIHLYRLYDDVDAPDGAPGCTVRALPHAKVVCAIGPGLAPANLRAV